MAKDRRQISVKGGGTLKVRQIDPTPNNTFTDLGFLGESKLTDAYNMIESKDDAGNYIDTKEAGEEVTFESSLLQTAKEQIDFMKNAKDQYFECYYPVLLNNGKYQEILIPVARIIPGEELEFKAGERRIKLTIKALWPAAALTRNPTDYNSAIGEYYKLIENSSAKGAPVDNATVPQAAI